MTRAEFIVAMKALGVTPYRFAKAIGVTKNATHKWSTGKAAVPNTVAVILAELRQSKGFRTRLLGKEDRPPSAVVTVARRAKRNGETELVAIAAASTKRVKRCKPDARLESKAAVEKRRR